ncbi:MAG: ABC transporter substrate-binding protein [Ruminococcus sp.]
MSSMVLDLQNEVTKQDCDIVNVLRKAHLISAKLGLTDFEKWITCELNGYKKGDVLPDYRTIKGTLKAYTPFNGWIPAVITDQKTEDALCIADVANSISEIIELCSNSKNKIFTEYTGKQLELINNLFDEPFTRFALYLSPSAIKDIVEKVKTTVLEWTIKLEENGIMGEGMQFNSDEKETAKTISQPINNYYGSTNIINAPIESSAIIAGNNNSIMFTYDKIMFTYDKANNAISQIESSLNNEPISDEDKESAIELLTEIREKISVQKRPTIIKSALIGLKDFLVSAGASATVAIIQAKMQGLF